MENKKVLILYASLGAGHGRAAKALEEAFAFYFPEIESKSVDVLDFAFEIFRSALPRAFNYTTKKTPFLYKWIYDHFDGQSRNGVLNRASDALIRKSRLVQFINNFDPDFILSTNPLPMHLVSMTKQKKIIDIFSANVCTDFGFHSFWYNQDVNYYFTATEEIRNKLVEHGVSQEKIVITGIPTSLKFGQTADRQKILKEIDFREEFPVLLIVGGKINYRTLLRVVEGVERNNSSIQFAIIAGRDEKLRRDLEKSPLNKKKNVKVLGFVNNIQDYMAASDIIVTKAGGLTVAECMQKGLPMVINDFIPGQEQDNVDYLLKHGAGIRAEDTQGAIRAINKLLLNHGKLVLMKENCRKIAKPDAARDIAKFVAEKLSF